MLKVTTSARSKIQDAVAEGDLPLRLEPGDDGGFHLTPDDWRSGDMSYAFDGSPILVVRGDLAHRLADWAVELDRQADDLRARRHEPDKSGQPAPVPPARQTRPIQLSET